MTRSLSKFALIVCAFTSFVGGANAAGVVDENVRFIADQGYVEVRAGQFTAIPLPRDMDRYEVSIKVHNKQYDDVDALVCNDQGVRLLQAGQSVRCHGVGRGRGTFDFTAPGSADQLYLVINNGFSLILTKKVSYRVAVVDRLDANARQSFLQMAEGISSMIQKTFKVPEFDIAIRPCGEINAYSHTRTGDITVCSELMFQEMKKGRKGALLGIILHEIGHSLLSLWNIPGNSNEELVDEFAVVMMHVSGDQGIAYQLADYFAEVDAHREALSKIYKDDRHPLSPQRVRNIKRILNDPGPVIERWNQILYPRMTANGLREALRTSPKFADRGLAEKLINGEPTDTSSSASPSTSWGPPPQQ